MTACERAGEDKGKKWRGKARGRQRRNMEMRGEVGRMKEEREAKVCIKQLTYIRVSNNLEWNKKRFGIQKLKAAA